MIKKVTNAVAKNLLVTASLIALILPLSACSNKTADHDDDHDGVEAHEDHDDDEGLIMLTDERIKQLGVEATEVQPGDFSNVLKVSGEITAMPGSDGVVAARQSGIVKLSAGVAEGATVAAGKTVASVTAKGVSGGDPNEAARVAYDAAKRELDRITPLHNEGIVTTREYNAARQRVDEARVALSGSPKGGSSATAPISGTITSIAVADGEFVEVGQTIATISSNNALSLRADLPGNSVGFMQNITGAKFRPSYSSEVVDVMAAGGSLITKSSNTVATNGYIPVYFSLPKGKNDVINGSYCEVYLLGSPRTNVLAVPEEAISEQQGRYFVYVEVEPCHFEKRPVSLGESDGTHREILSGVNAGEKVVTKGMTYVKLAETSGVVPEAHSHSH